VNNRESDLTLRVGEEHEVRLSGLATAGYHWSCEVEWAQDALTVTKQRASPHDPPDPSDVGTSTDEIFRITALRPGTATLRFTQGRRWETDTPPLNTLVVGVDVLG
jgi:predicted secreted protein